MIVPCNSTMTNLSFSSKALPGMVLLYRLNDILRVHRDHIGQGVIISLI